MGTRFPIFRHVVITLILVRAPELYNLSTMTCPVINRVTNPVDLTKNANLCLLNEEHKQELERR
jgi:hypothetical protein